MSLKIVDVSVWQRGLDFKSLKDANPDLAGAICRASYGLDEDATFRSFMGDLESLGLLMGAYHYIEGDGVSAEIDTFLSAIDDYLYKCIICLDWEKTNNKRWGELEYLEDCCNYVIERTGVRPLVYASKLYFPYDLCEKLNLGTWVAQYATDGVVLGFQEKPWNESNCACSIRQYSGNGRLCGYDNPIDLDKAYMDEEAWARYADPNGVLNSSGNDVENSDEFVIAEFNGTVKIPKDSLT